jgi:hypothetical protein
MIRLRKRTLWLVSLLLLIQLLLRAHAITELPYFIDEDNHIQRAAAVRHLEQHPAQYSHGKFFFYIWLAVVDLKQRDTALHLARTLLALTSLLTSALIFRLVKRFSDENAALLAVAFYALVPYAVFYERMALADPFAGLLGILTLWLALRLADQPTYRRAILVGLAAAITVAAKLTLSFVVGFPVLALLLFAPHNGFKNAVRRYGLLLMVSGITFILLWLPVLIPARLSVTNADPADDFVLLNTILLEEPSIICPGIEKLSCAWDKSATMLSLPLLLVGIGLVAWGMIRKPRTMIFLLAALVLVWLPSIAIVDNTQTRYLMSGVPIIAVMLGVGARQFFTSPPNPLSKWRGGSVTRDLPSPFRQGESGNKQLPSPFGEGLGVRSEHILAFMLLIWAATFALPFAFTLMSDPPEVRVPPLDDKNYFWDRYNGYGNREAMAYLQAYGERHEDQVIVFPLTKVCNQVDLDRNPNVKPICIADYYRQKMADIRWAEAVMPYLQKQIPVYVMTSEQPDVPSQENGIRWEQVAVFPKPRGIQTVILWRLTLEA